MKNIYWYSLFILNISIYLSQSVCAQTVRLSQFQSETVIEILERQKLHELPTLEDSKLINSLQKSIIDSAKYELLLDVKELLDKYLVESPIDSQFIRENYKLLGYRIKKYLLNIDTAIDCYQVAHQYGGELAGVTDVWFVENVLGTHYNRKGDHEKAIYFFGLTQKRLKEIIHDDNTPLKDKIYYQSKYPRLLNNIGYLHFWNKEYVIAEDTLLKSRKLAQQYNSIEGYVYANQKLAELYLITNRPIEAKYYIDDTKILLDKIPEEKQNMATSAHYRLSGTLAEYQEKFDEAINDYKLSLKYLNQNTGSKFTRDYAKTYHRLARVFLKNQDYTEARIMIDQGFEALLTNTGDALKGYVISITENTNAELFELLGQYYQSKFEITQQSIYLDSAYQAFFRASDIYNEIRITYLMRGSKLLNVSDHRRNINQLVQILWMQNNLGGNKTEIAYQADSLFLVSNNLLLAEISEERRVLTKIDPRQKEQIEILQDSLVKWTGKLREESNVETRTEWLGKILNTNDQIKEILQNENPQIPIIDHPNIKYFFGTQYLYVTDNLNGKIRFNRAGLRSNIEKQIKASIEGIQKKITTRDFFNNQHELYCKLISPLEPLPDRFTIYPDALLYYVSFQCMLVDTLPRKYLAQECIIDIGFLSKKPSKFKPLSISKLTTIAPSYSLYHENNPNGLLYLPSAQDEVQSISNIWPGSTDQLVDISFDDIKHSMKTSDVIHFAGHALVDGDNSYLALDTDSLSWVHHEDIASHTSDAHLVILSACETGSGVLELGEGVRSMAKSFLYSGVHQVVYTLWSIQDAITKVIMTSFYNYLIDEHDVAKAITLAQRDHLGKSNPRYHHPFYWSAFQSSYIDVPNNRNWSKGLLFILGLSLIIVFYILIKSKLK